MSYILYSDRLAVSYFDIRANTCVSQVYSYKNLLLAVLCDAIGHEDSNYREKYVDKLHSGHEDSNYREKHVDELRRT